jgi:hypothetical protein
MFLRENRWASKPSRKANGTHSILSALCIQAVTITSVINDKLILIVLFIVKLLTYF